MLVICTIDHHQGIPTPNTSHKGYAVLGAGFTGLSVAWHLLNGTECWKESLNLLNVAEGALFKLVNRAKQDSPPNSDPSIVKKRIEFIHEDACCSKSCACIFVPLNETFYMPEALSINSQCYLEALYLACVNLAEGKSKVRVARKELSLHMKSAESNLELAWYPPYDFFVCVITRAVIDAECGGGAWKWRPAKTAAGVKMETLISNDWLMLEKAFLKQPKVFLCSKKTGKGKRPGNGGNRYWKSVGLGFKTPREAIEGTYIDKKCPFTGDVSIRGHIVSGTCHSAKMMRTIIVRRNYLHWIRKYRRSLSSFLS
ncbi:unnamed protein product [Fraxinus pennsylvanica]|uniref:Small ribosomal subunit protein uS17 N-terminal domain-containing protein n=1 Tax=Fraxinus pennsylvanica TaxID=56036 RepID=A0AAD1ZQK5_9LAMI|nr:unnamed protein product [Fraxinus pennsylvanica]